MKRVLVALLICSVVAGGLLAVGMYADRNRLYDVAARFLETVWTDNDNMSAYDLTSPAYGRFHPRKRMLADLERWQAHLGAWRGLGEQRSDEELSPGRRRVSLAVQFEKGTAMAHFTFVNVPGGAWPIENFELVMDPESDLPPDESQLAERVNELPGEFVDQKHTELWENMTVPCMIRRTPDGHMALLTGPTNDLGIPGPVTVVEPLAKQPDGTWTITRRYELERGTVQTTMTLRWVGLKWLVDRYEVQRVDKAE